MITVRYLNDPNQECMIRPTPFVAISMSPQRNKECMVGVTYTITLTGTILSDEGMPYALHPNDWQQLLPAHASTGAIGTRTGPFKAFDKTGVSSRPRPPKQKVTKHSHAILSKQRILRSLFARDNQIIQISDIEDENAPVMWFFARFVSCSFEEVMKLAEFLIFAGTAKRIVLKKILLKIFQKIGKLSQKKILKTCQS